jgi:endonuclease IV
MTTETTKVEAIQAIANAIDNLVDNIDPNNAYGETVGDCLYNIGYQFSRIADAMEKIANKQ